MKQVGMLRLFDEDSEGARTCAHEPNCDTVQECRDRDPHSVDAGKTPCGRRLRIFDWNSRWFWVVVFYRRTPMQPVIDLEVWHPNTWSRWFNWWQWEGEPETHLSSEPVRVADIAKLVNA